MVTEQQDKDETLLRLVNNYVEKNKLYSELKDRLSEHKDERPEKPMRVASLKVLEDYYALFKNWEFTNDAIKVNIRGLLSQLSDCKKDIIKLISVSNVWLEVGDYVVGIYLDAWGGNHLELDIKPISDNPPPLKDRIHYP